ncbi:MAG TPA: hypothetical protein VMB71_01110 [Acetobacteraceae bacterium]|nr:hypothetical protein [Acetobacteraceae bacterium]
MRRFMYAGIAALLVTSGSALAQSETETTTTTTGPAVVAPPAPVPPPPVGTLAQERTTRSVDAYGNQVVSRQTTYRDPTGVARDTQTTTTTPAIPPPPATTTTTTTESTTTGPQY